MERCCAAMSVVLARDTNGRTGMREDTIVNFKTGDVGYAVHVHFPRYIPGKNDDAGFPEFRKRTAMRINYCPFCGKNLEE